MWVDFLLFIFLCMMNNPDRNKGNSDDNTNKKILKITKEDLILSMQLRGKSSWYRIIRAFADNPTPDQTANILWWEGGNRYDFLDSNAPFWGYIQEAGDPKDTKASEALNARKSKLVDQIFVKIREHREYQENFKKILLNLPPRIEQLIDDIQVYPPSLLSYDILATWSQKSIVKNNMTMNEDEESLRKILSDMNTKRVQNEQALKVIINNHYLQHKATANLYKKLFKESDSRKTYVWNKQKNNERYDTMHSTFDTYSGWICNIVVSQLSSEWIPTIGTLPIKKFPDSLEQEEDPMWVLYRFQDLLNMIKYHKERQPDLCQNIANILESVSTIPEDEKDILHKILLTLQDTTTIVHYTILKQFKTYIQDIECKYKS